MAERTSKKATTKKPVTKKTAAAKKPLKTSQPPRFSQIPNKVTGGITRLYGRINALTPLQKLGIVSVVILILLAAYYKNLFVVVLVNGQPIFRWTVVSQLEQQGGQRALNQLVTETLILQEARENSITVTQQEIDEEMKKIEESVTAEGGSFEEALASQGYTRESLERSLLINKTVEKLVQDQVTVTEEEINKYLEENKDTLPKDQPAEEIRSSVTEELKSTKQEEKAQELVEKLRSEADINLFINY
jgi:hypothetical protein